MRINPWFILVILTATSCGTRGSGRLTTETRRAVDFTEIGLDGAANLTIDVVPGAKTEVLVTTDENLLPGVTTTVQNGTLEIGVPSDLHPTMGVEVSVRTANLAQLDMQGAGKAKVQGITGPRLELWLAGTSSARLQGDVTAAELHVVDSSALHALALRTGNVSLDLGGAASAEVFATGQADIHTAGARNVIVGGHPRQIHMSGAGRVQLR